MLRSPQFIIRILILFASTKAFAQKTLQTERDSNQIEIAAPYSFEAGTYGTQRDSDPPSYVRRPWKDSKTAPQTLRGLVIGLDFRSRAEYRHFDIRRPSLIDDTPVLLRTRAYLGLTQAWDPLRFGFEFEDAHRINSAFEPDNRDINRGEVIQSYVELNFAKLGGRDPRGQFRPAMIRFGKQAFELLDRRLVANNAWRNTTNNFYGIRTSLGGEQNDWQVEAMWMHPIQRKSFEWDTPIYDQQIWMFVGHWRNTGRRLIVEPYYFRFDQRPSSVNAFRERHIESPGLRIFGKSPSGRWNYEATATYQFGSDRDLNQNALMLTSEFGHTWLDSPQKFRLSWFNAYASGDRNAADGEMNRFERFFGFARPWSSDDYIIPENVLSSRIRLESIFWKTLKFDGGYSVYWLASSTDRMNNLLDSQGNRDVSGGSGAFVGHGPDLRLRYNVHRSVNLNFGSSFFVNGDFVRNRQRAELGRSEESSFFTYLEVNFNLIDFW